MAAKLDRADEKVMTNHAKYITDMITGFTTGNPVSISPANGKDIKAITDAQDQMDIDSHNTEMEKDLSVFGCAYELLYIKKVSDATTELAIEKIDPRGCVLVTDDTLDKNPLFGIYYVEKKDLLGNAKGYLITVYTPTGLFSIEPRQDECYQMLIWQANLRPFNIILMVSHLLSIAITKNGKVILSKRLA
jgi:SPP1 family phage portal protein